MPSPRELWRDAVAALKDKGSLYLTRMGSGRRHHRSGHCGPIISPEVDAAVIRATSHNKRSVDYKSAGRVFGWARAAPAAFLQPIMWSLAHRVNRTRSWVVALKVLLVAHGLLLCSDDVPPYDGLGRLPFDLADFRGRSSSDSGFAAFVRAYFRFLDRRSFFGVLGPLRAPASASRDGEAIQPSFNSDSDEDLERLERLQILLDLLIQIRPYADGMEVGLVLEAMDCVVIEIFEVYSSICNGIAHFLSMLGSGSSSKLDKNRPLVIVEGEGEEVRRRRRGAIGVRILRRAKSQCAQLSAYFDLCRKLGVLNVTEFPPVERIPDEDIDDLEILLLDGIPIIPEKDNKEEEEKEKLSAVEQKKEEKKMEKHFGTVISKEWVAFEDEGHSRKRAQGHSKSNPFLWSPEKQPWLTPAAATPSWAVVLNSGRQPLSNDNLIELI